MGVFVAAERDNAAITSWDGERLVLRRGSSIKLRGDRCLVCGVTEQVEPRGRSFVGSKGATTIFGLFLLVTAPKFVGPFGTLLGLGVLLSATNHRARVTFPLCGGCALRGFAIKALAWGLGLPAFVALPIVGGAIGEVLDGRQSVGMLVGGFAAGLVAFWCLAKLWQTFVTTRVAVTCVNLDDTRVTLRVPCRGAVDDMVARLDER